MNRRTLYMREYYRRHAAAISRRKCHRQQVRHWCAWLLANLTWPTEPTPTIPTPYPIRRPTLRLR